MRKAGITFGIIAALRLAGNRALSTLGAQTWFAGLRRDQSGSRASLPVLAVQRGVFKILPIIDWDNRQVHQYLKQHGLSYHPLWDEGYLSVGDTHTTRKWEPGMAEEETRFFGLKREFSPCFFVSLSRTSVNS